MASTPDRATPPPRPSAPPLPFEKLILVSEDTPTIAVYSSRVPVIDIETGVCLNAPALIPPLRYASSATAQHEAFLRPYFSLWDRAQRRGEDALRQFYDRVTHAVLHIYGWDAPFGRDLNTKSPSLLSSRFDSPPPLQQGMTKGIAMEISCEVHRRLLQIAVRWFTEQSVLDILAPPPTPPLKPARSLSPSIPSGSRHVAGATNPGPIRRTRRHRNTRNISDEEVSSPTLQRGRGSKYTRG
ncbi:hypothetical protein EIP86_005984 [Pleurotus ostreatoroseus]|nr:hypothetical protein EIP86_005984 [Pleurotus ostreatoroseus]